MSIQRMSLDLARKAAILTCVHLTVTVVSRFLLYVERSNGVKKTGDGGG